MSATAETRNELAIDTALQNANADQLRRALQRQLRRQQLVPDDEDWHQFDPETGPIEDTEALDEAAIRWRRGERREALHHLEIALGRDFSGLGDLQPEHLK